MPIPKSLCPKGQPNGELSGSTAVSRACSAGCWRMRSNDWFGRANHRTSCRRYNLFLRTGNPLIQHFQLQRPIVISLNEKSLTHSKTIFNGIVIFLSKNKTISQAGDTDGERIKKNGFFGVAGQFFYFNFFLIQAGSLRQSRTAYTITSFPSLV